MCIRDRSLTGISADTLGDLAKLVVTGIATFNNDVQIGSAATFHDNGGQFHLKTGYFNVRSHLGEDMIIANNNDSVQLFFDNNQKLVTTNSGVIVTGILTANQFYGDGSNLTGVGGGTSPGQVAFASTAGISTLTSSWNVTNDGSSHYEFTGPGNLSSADKNLTFQ